MADAHVIRKITRASVGVVAAVMLVGLAPSAAAQTSLPAHSAGATAVAPAPAADAGLAATSGSDRRKERDKERRRDSAALRLVNEERAKAGCAPLRQVAKLQAAADKQSQDQADRDRAGHDGANGSSIASRLDPLGYRQNAENTAQQQGAGSAVKFWLESKGGHREHMLNCAFTETGLDSEKSSSGKIYWTQTFGG